MNICFDHHLQDDPVAQVGEQLRAFSSAVLMSSGLFRHLSIHQSVRPSICKQGTICNYWAPEAGILHGESLCDHHIACPQL